MIKISHLSLNTIVILHKQCKVIEKNTTQVRTDSNTQLGIDTLNIEIPSAPQSVQQYGGNLSGDVQTRRVKQTS